MAGATDNGNRSARRLAAVVVGACLAASAVAVPAIAQDAEPLTVEVKKVIVPNTQAKLTQKGVLVKARCNADCVLVVKVRVPQRVANDVGLDSRVIGTGAAGAKANRYRWVRATINKGAGRALADFNGGGRLDIRIKALP